VTWLDSPPQKLKKRHAMEKILEQTKILYELLNENKGYGDFADDQTVRGEYRTTSFQWPIVSNVQTGR
jgi:hypothetical protein